MKKYNNKVKKYKKNALVPIQINKTIVDKKLNIMLPNPPLIEILLQT